MSDYYDDYDGVDFSDPLDTAVEYVSELHDLGLIDDEELHYIANALDSEDGPVVVAQLYESARAFYGDSDSESDYELEPDDDPDRGSRYMAEIDRLQTDNPDMNIDASDGAPFHYFVSAADGDMEEAVAAYRTAMRESGFGRVDRKATIDEAMDEFMTRIHPTPKESRLENTLAGIADELSI